MSEESKTAEGDYVIMGQEAVGRGPSSKSLGLDDPSLSQEEKDHRLAVALQQQENAAAYEDHKKKHDEFTKANEHRTARSATFTKLAAVRQKDHGMLSVPAEYSSEDGYKKEGYTPGVGLVAPPPGAPPQVIEDYKLALELQKVEQVDAGTVRTMEKIVKVESQEEEAQAHRTERSNYHISQKGMFKNK
jgi:hypothetical protein